MQVQFNPFSGELFPAATVSTAGANCLSLLHGPDTPNPGIGVDGDYYLNTTINDLYTKAAGVWGDPIANFNGTQGATGAAGATLRHGPELPHPGIGADGDYYLHTSTNDLYTRAAGVWGNPIANFKGTQGNPGAAGATLRHGPELPHPGIGADGDYYLHTSTNDLYTRAAGVWGDPIANFQGIQGGPGQAIFHRDEWNSATAYIPGDGVTHGGSSYFCKAGHSNQEPPNTTYWGLLAAKGEPGAGVVSGMAPGGLLIGAADGGVTQEAGNLFWSNANKRLGIGTALPQGPLQVSLGTPSIVDLTLNATGINVVNNDPSYPPSLASMTNGSLNTPDISFFDGIMLVNGMLGLTFSVPVSITEFWAFVFDWGNPVYTQLNSFKLQQYDGSSWSDISALGVILNGSGSGTSLFGTDLGANSSGWVKISIPSVICFGVRLVIQSLHRAGTKLSVTELKAFGYPGFNPNAFIVTDAGNVGLGTATPVALLDVHSTNSSTLAQRLYRSSSITTDPVLMVHSDVGGTNTNVFSIMANGSYGTISDPKLKSTPEDATSKLNDLMRLRIVNFRFKGDPFHKNIGVLASEFREVFPSLVRSVPDTMTIPDPDYILKEGETESDRPVIVRKTGTFTDFVVTSPMTWILVKSLQEEVAQRKALEARVAVLEARQ
ncbi:MAG: hypothetical protein HQL84_10035 [Magnetococcales bacterium]|nr:hypothetical protein [Magnetococcales bacterium]